MDYIIKLKDKKIYDSLVHFLKSLGINILSVTPISNKKTQVDAVSLIFESTLGEEWNSKEDEAWDKVL